MKSHPPHPLLHASLAAVSPRASGSLPMPDSLSAGSAIDAVGMGKPLTGFADLIAHQMAAQSPTEEPVLSAEPLGSGTESTEQALAWPVDVGTPAWPLPALPMDASRPVPITDQSLHTVSTGTHDTDDRVLSTTGPSLKAALPHEAAAWVSDTGHATVGTRAEPLTSPALPALADPSFAAPALKSSAPVQSTPVQVQQMGPQVPPAIDVMDVGSSMKDGLAYGALKGSARMADGVQALPLSQTVPESTSEAGAIVASLTAPEGRGDLRSHNLPPEVARSASLMTAPSERTQAVPAEQAGATQLISPAPGQGPMASWQVSFLKQEPAQRSTLEAFGQRFVTSHGKPAAIGEVRKAPESITTAFVDAQRNLPSMASSKDQVVPDAAMVVTPLASENKNISVAAPQDKDEVATQTASTASAAPGLLASDAVPVALTATVMPAATSVHVTGFIEHPVGSAGFGQALVDHVRVWVKQTSPDEPLTAELRLNPEEMGPVRIRIELDGATAQVNFFAAHADTRQAIESSLGQLSQAMSQAGLQLQGGGVSDQASQQFATSQMDTRGDGQGQPRQPAAQADTRWQGSSGQRAVNADAGPENSGIQMPRSAASRSSNLDMYA